MGGGRNRVQARSRGKERRLSFAPVFIAVAAQSSAPFGGLPWAGKLQDGLALSNGFLPVAVYGGMLSVAFPSRTVNRNVLPRPGSLSTAISPPIN
jgi:hypothetical protein